MHGPLRGKEVVEREEYECGCCAYRRTRTQLSRYGTTAIGDLWVDGDAEGPQAAPTLFQAVTALLLGVIYYGSVLLRRVVSLAFWGLVIVLITSHDLELRVLLRVLVAIWKSYYPDREQWKDEEPVVLALEWKPAEPPHLSSWLTSLNPFEILWCGGNGTIYWF